MRAEFRWHSARYSTHCLRVKLQAQRFRVGHWRIRMGRGFFWGGEQGIQLLAHGGRQVVHQLRGELLLDRAKGLGDETR